VKAALEVAYKEEARNQFLPEQQTRTRSNQVQQYFIRFRLLTVDAYKEPGILILCFPMLSLLIKLLYLETLSTLLHHISSPITPLCS
jgi:hypothetical protein